MWDERDASLIFQNTNSHDYVISYIRHAKALLYDQPQPIGTPFFFFFSFEISLHYNAIITCKPYALFYTQTMESELEPTSPRSPLARNPSLPKSRAPEFYGFAALTLTYAFFALYVLWALLPDEWILFCGIQWYPSR